MFRPLALLLAVSAFAFAAIACGGGDANDGDLPEYPEPTIVTPAGDGSDAEAVDEILELSRDQAQAIDERDWQDLYDTFSPRQQAACPFDEFVDAAEDSAQGQEGFDVSLFTFDTMAIDVQGDRANFTFTSRYDGFVVQVVEEDNPDVFVEIDGEWYDELDTHAPFGCA